MFGLRTGIKHARNIEIITVFGNLVSVFSMFQACFHVEHWSMPAVTTFVKHTKPHYPNWARKSGIKCEDGWNYQI